MIPETDWAYLAGMMDGEGYMAIYRHFTANKGMGRGYQIETKLEISNMNLANLEEMQRMFQLGVITTRTDHKDDGTTRISYVLRYNVGSQRLVLKKIIPYLKQKKASAEILYELVLFRTMFKAMVPYTTKSERRKAKPFIEAFYLDLEKKFEQATLEQKPWLLIAKTKKAARRIKREGKMIAEVRTPLPSDSWIKTRTGEA